MIITKDLKKEVSGSPKVTKNQKENNGKANSKQRHI